MDDLATIYVAQQRSAPSLEMDLSRCVLTNLGLWFMRTLMAAHTCSRVARHERHRNRRRSAGTSKLHVATRSRRSFLRPLSGSPSNGSHLAGRFAIFRHSGVWCLAFRQVRVKDRRRFVKSKCWTERASRGRRCNMLIRDEQVQLAFGTIMALHVFFSCPGAIRHVLHLSLRCYYTRESVFVLRVSSLKLFRQNHSITPAIPSSPISLQTPCPISPHDNLFVSEVGAIHRRPSCSLRSRAPFGTLPTAEAPGSPCLPPSLCSWVSWRLPSTALPPAKFLLKAKPDTKLFWGTAVHAYDTFEASK